MMMKQTAWSPMVSRLAQPRPVSDARPTSRFRFDLERVVWDPAYRRWVKGELNRRAAEETRGAVRRWPRAAA